MAKVEEKDLIGGTVSESLDGGITATRIFIVTGVTGESQNRMRTAIELDEIPKLKELHPAYAVKVKVSSKDARALSNGQVEVIVNYAEIIDEESSKISLGSTVQLERTNFSFKTKKNKNKKKTKRNQQIILKHKFDEGTDGERTETQTAEVDTQEPNATIVFNNKRTFGLNIIIGIFEIVGRINGGKFITTGDDRQWLCTSITAESNDSGKNFDLTYEFQHKKEGWDPTVIFIDPRTDRPVEDPGKPGKRHLLKMW